ncbi:MAG: AAA family ATPase [Bryobacteraceae bacterium]
MGRFQDISIKGFRRLADVQLELRPLSVLIGANGIGKTSVLDALWLLARSAQGSLNVSISELGGLPGLTTYDRADGLAFEISMSVEQHPPLCYSLRLTPQGLGYNIDGETLSQQRRPEPPPFMYITARGPSIRYFKEDEQRLAQPAWSHDLLETSLSQVPKMYREPEEFRQRLASSTSYHVLNVDPRSPVRLPQPMRPATLPGKNGEDLVSCLYYLRETDRDRFESIEDALHTAFQGFERLEFPPVAAGTLAMSWRDKNLSKPLYTNQLSEGMLRFLWLATLLQSPGLTALTLIDEPEVSLHPELLSLLSDLFREASTRTQLVIATHSDRLVRFLKPSEVVVMDATDDGMAKLTWADKLNLDEWLAEYSLGEVWRRGRMGGRA